ncbi:hypothetical protein ACQEUU_15050 [Nonomuraea sp. CA-218870]
MTTEVGVSGYAASAVAGQGGGAQHDADRAVGCQQAGGGVLDRVAL